MSKAAEAVDAIIADLSDRRGLRQAWESIDEDVRDEIRDEWGAPRGSRDQQCVARPVALGHRERHLRRKCADPECYRFDPVPFGEVVRAERERQGMTQQQLATAVNRLEGDAVDVVAQQHVSAYESGVVMPTFSRARAFADALGLSMDRLAGRVHHESGDRFPIRQRP